MSISAVVIGDRVTVTATFFDTATPPAPADPTTIQILHRTPDGVEAVYVFGTDPEVIRDSVGVYHADLRVILPRTHYFRSNGLGTIEQSEETSVSVPESAFDTPLP